jgi:hypothetical protein
MLHQPGKQQRQQHSSPGGSKAADQQQEQGVAGVVLALSSMILLSTSRMAMLRDVQLQLQQQQVAEARQLQQQQLQLQLMKTMRMVCMTSLMQGQMWGVPLQGSSSSSSTGQAAANQQGATGQAQALQQAVMQGRVTLLASFPHQPWCAMQHLPTLATCCAQ